MFYFSPVQKACVALGFSITSLQAVNLSQHAIESPSAAQDSYVSYLPAHIDIRNLASLRQGIHHKMCQAFTTRLHAGQVHWYELAGGYTVHYVLSKTTSNALGKHFVFSPWKGSVDAKADMNALGQELRWIVWYTYIHNRFAKAPHSRSLPGQISWLDTSPKDFLIWGSAAWSYLFIEGFMHRLHNPLNKQFKIDYKDTNAYLYHKWMHEANLSNMASGDMDRLVTYWQGYPAQFVSNKMIAMCEDINMLYLKLLKKKIPLIEYARKPELKQFYYDSAWFAFKYLWNHFRPKGNKHWFLSFSEKALLAINRRDNNKPLLPTVRINNLYLRRAQSIYALHVGWSFSNSPSFFQYVGLSTRNLYTYRTPSQWTFTFDGALRGDKFNDYEARKETWGFYLDLQASVDTRVGKFTLHYVPPVYGESMKKSAQSTMYVTFWPKA